MISTNATTGSSGISQAYSIIAQFSVALIVSFSYSFSNTIRVVRDTHVAKIVGITLTQFAVEHAQLSPSCFGMHQALLRCGCHVARSLHLEPHALSPHVSDSPR